MIKMSIIEIVNIPIERSQIYQVFCLNYEIVHFFSSVAHVWVPGAKTTGPIVEKVVFFLNLIFSAVRNFIR
jgi:hypothetical protein